MEVYKKRLFFIIILLFILFWGIYFFNKDFFQINNILSKIEILKNFIYQNYLVSIIAFTFFYSFLILCNFPIASLISMVSGFLFGIWVGAIIAILAGTLGAYGIFTIAKFFFLDYIKKNILNKYSFIEDYFNKNDIELMLLIRIIPGIPFFLQNLLLASLGAENKKFIYTSLIGFAPWSFIFCSVGNGLDDIMRNNIAINFQLFLKIEFIMPILILIMVLLVILIFKKRIIK